MLRFLLRKARKAMINMSTINSIRQQRRDGFSISDIAKMNGVSRDTVYKYLAQDDFSPSVFGSVKTDIGDADKNLYRLGAGKDVRCIHMGTRRGRLSSTLDTTGARRRP